MAPDEKGQLRDQVTQREKGRRKLEEHLIDATSIEAYTASMEVF